MRTTSGLAFLLFVAWTTFGFTANVEAQSPAPGRYVAKQMLRLLNDSSYNPPRQNNCDLLVLLDRWTGIVSVRDLTPPKMGWSRTKPVVEDGTVPRFEVVPPECPQCSDKYGFVLDFVDSATGDYFHVSATEINKDHLVVVWGPSQG